MLEEEQELEELEELKEKIHRERGFLCHFYKDKCLRRRIGLRMRARGTATFRSYASLLDVDSAEYELLLDTLTVNVTRFFRDAETWGVVRSLVVPALLDGAERPVKVWSAGCASGEEPYSVAILLREAAERAGGLDALDGVSVVGTDIDRPSLLAARAASYDELALQDTPPDLRERWFSPGPPYRLHDDAARLVTFRPHDLLAEEAEGDQSLILCRNVIIYLSRDVQEGLLQRLHAALRPGGFLVLGKVETILGPTRSLFHAVDSRLRVFRRPP